METIVTTKQGSLEGLLSEDKQTVIFRGFPMRSPLWESCGSAGPRSMPPGRESCPAGNLLPAALRRI